MFRDLTRRLASTAYWLIHNRARGTFVASNDVSRKASIGRHCWIRQGVEIHDSVTVGDYSYIVGPGTLIDEAVIGKFCSIARNAIIGPPGHNYDWVSTHPFIYLKSYGFAECNRPIFQKNPPTIGNDVWIGVNSVILRGVHVRDGSIIAAGSIVTRDVEPYSIVAGVPARHLKYRFPEQTREALLGIQWWNWGDEQLKEALPLLSNVEEFLVRYGPMDRPIVVGSEKGEARIGWRAAARCSSD